MFFASLENILQNDQNNGSYTYSTTISKVSERHEMKGILNLNFCILLIQYVAATTPTASYYHDISLSSYSGEVSYLSGHSNRGNFGDSVQAIGDFNGDGYGDFAIGAYWESSNGRYYNGNIYVFLGSTNRAMNITTNSFHNTTRFIIYGEASNYFTGISVSGAGDVNGDGLSDLIVSTELAMAQDAIRNGGTSYVIFGTKEIPAYLDLLTMTNTQGFRIWGANEFDSSGSSVAAAGDVNKDGYADVIVGAYNATKVGYANTGAAYVIYGKASGFVNIDLLLMTSSQGFRIYGAVAGEDAGYSVSGADVNGDGYSDLIIGAYYSDSFTGKVYVLFGKAGNRPTFQLQDMVLGTDGFIIEAAESGDGLGVAVAGLMDVNGDKIPDLVVGSHWATWDYRAHCGVAYILFGKSSFAGTIDLGNITSRDGFSVIGAVINYNTGSAVSSAGDVNGDGVGDIIIGSNQATVNGNTNAGITHIIFGSRLTADIDLLRFPSTRGFYIEGAHTGDYSGTSVGGGADFNGDGLGDIIIGATGAAGSITDAGMAYIVYGMLNPPPTGEPTSQPSKQPTTQPTKRPTRHPTSQPTRRPSSQPTSQPTRQPTGQPTAKPTRAPTGQPTRRPSRKPTGQPSSQPRGQPSRRPASRPSSRPSGQPSRRPSGQPSKRPSSQPTIFPSHRPTKAPSPQPSSRPSKQPNSFPTSVPSPAPTPSPTFAPTLPIATSEVYIRLVNVSTNIFSTEAQDALIETMNRILTYGISVSYKSIPDSVQYGTHRWDVVVNLHLIEPLNNFKNIYGTNETKFTTAIKEELLTSVNSGQFSSILKELAQIYNATEIASTSAATMIEFNSYTNLIESSSNDDNSDFNIFSFSEELSIIIICLGGVIVILLFSVIIFCAWQSYLANMIQRLSGVRKTVFIENVTIQTWNNDVDDFQDNIFSYTEEQEKNLQKSPFRQIRRDLEAGDKHTELQFPN